MKTAFFIIFTLFLMACQVGNESIIEPSLTKISGQWQLTKTSIGYPAPNSPTEIKATNTEIISFDSNNKTFTRTVNGKVTETTDFDVQKVSYNGSEPREAVVFTKTQYYAFLTFDDANSSIILYEKAPIGAILADGNSYHYQKVK
ncbi:hypothetical protein GCM10011514_40350 [Emticicia aquatilis]|uniref:Lipocalin-like domain-containing protein n=1 Tax=Emticicia aquatilis TaxID=1537369 RepID=A0A916Z1X1_9BACT|nr:hypothetical protein [Emticicia aquatilis]GGD72129.1 hypothetical protein GCM10011514_40350 [Emticicia aquatilis]